MKFRLLLSKCNCWGAYCCCCGWKNWFVFICCWVGAICWCCCSCWWCCGGWCFWWVNALEFSPQSPQSSPQPSLLLLLVNAVDAENGAAMFLPWYRWWFGCNTAVSDLTQLSLLSIAWWQGSVTLLPFWLGAAVWEVLLASAKRLKYVLVDIGWIAGWFQSFSIDSYMHTKRWKTN